MVYKALYDLYHITFVLISYEFPFHLLCFSNTGVLNCWWQTSSISMVPTLGLCICCSLCKKHNSIRQPYGLSTTLYSNVCSHGTSSKALPDYSRQHLLTFIFSLQPCFVFIQCTCHYLALYSKVSFVWCVNSIRI